MFPEPTSEEPWAAWLFHGWIAHLTLFVALALAAALFGWCWNRALRPADRGPLVHGPMLIAAYGLLLLLRHVQGEWWQAAIIAGGMIIGGLLGRIASPRGIAMPLMLLGALLGLGLSLSALVLTGATMLVLLLSAGYSAR